MSASARETILTNRAGQKEANGHEMLVPVGPNTNSSSHVVGRTVVLKTSSSNNNENRMDEHKQTKRGTTNKQQTHTQGGYRIPNNRGQRTVQLGLASAKRKTQCATPRVFKLTTLTGIAGLAYLEASDKTLAGFIKTPKALAVQNPIRKQFCTTY